MLFHILNRGVGRMRLFLKDGDFEAFERVIQKTLQTRPMRIIAYCLMSNHWHMVLWPERDGDLGGFMQKLTITHARNWPDLQAAGVAHDALIYRETFNGEAFLVIYLPAHAVPAR